MLYLNKQIFGSANNNHNLHVFPVLLRVLSGHCPTYPPMHKPKSHRTLNSYEDKS